MAWSIYGRRLIVGALAGGSILCGVTHTVAASARTGQISQPSGTNPTPTATTQLNCSSSSQSCGRATLAILNRDRARYGLPALQLTRLQSSGRGRCAGSIGHSSAMARSGSIWHTNPKFPRASFPNNICVRYKRAGENVGMSDSGSTLADLQELDSLMMHEPHSRAVCANTINHACNIINPSFRHVGIGIYIDRGGTTWLTEDFTD